mgnify:CR=1 FL=1
MFDQRLHRFEQREALAAQVAPGVTSCARSDVVDECGQQVDRLQNDVDFRRTNRMLARAAAIEQALDGMGEVLQRDEAECAGIALHSVEGAEHVVQQRLVVGRFLEPSTIGSRVKNDVVRVQYSRSLSTRTTVIAAVRYSRENRLEDRIGETTNERSYADVWASYQLTPTWYVGGGYRFIRQDITSEPRAANDHSVFVNFGYRALDPRPRRAQ